MISLKKCWIWVMGRGSALSHPCKLGHFSYKTLKSTFTMCRTWHPLPLLKLEEILDISFKTCDRRGTFSISFKSCKGKKKKQGPLIEEDIKDDFTFVLELGSAAQIWEQRMVKLFTFERDLKAQSIIGARRLSRLLWKSCWLDSGSLECLCRPLPQSVKAEG